MMKRIIYLIIAGISIYILFAYNVKASNTQPKVDISVTSVFDNENLELSSVLNDQEYGSTLSLYPLSRDDYEFAFWVVNGAVRKDLPENHEFTVTSEMNFIAVFHKIDQFAVLFMDSNGKLLDVQFVSNEAGYAQEPVIDLPTKVGYIISDENGRWISTEGKKLSDEIFDNTVFVLQYQQIDNLDLYTVNVDGGYIETENGQVNQKEFQFNQIATIYAEEIEGKVFSHFEESGDVLSLNSQYQFTVLENRNIKAIYVDEGLNLNIRPMVIMSKPLNLRDNYWTYVSQFNVPDGYELIEYGILTSLAESNIDILTENVTIYQGRKYTEKTNEYVFSIAKSIHNTARAYIVVRDTVSREIEYYYNELDYPVNGLMQDSYYEYEGINYRLYDIDYSLATISFNNGPRSFKASINKDGTYLIKLPEGVYDVVITHPYFVDIKGNIIIDDKGNITDVNNVLNSSFTTPRLGGSVQSGTGNVGGGNDEALWTYENGNATASKVAQVYFSGQTGTKYMVEARIHNIIPSNTNTDRDKKVSIIVSGYNNGSLMRHAIFLDQDNNLVRLWNNGSWDPVNIYENHNLNLKSDNGHKLTLIRDGKDVYVFLDDVYLSKMVIPYGEETAFGFQTLGCGATYSDYSYSYNEALIDAMLTRTITLPELEDGMIESNIVDDIHLNDEITLTVTPNEGFIIKSFKAFLNGVEVPEIVLLNNQVTFRVKGDMTFQVEFEELPEETTTVNGKIEDSYYDFLGFDYKLYNIDYTLATVSFNNGTINYYATINEDGTYSVQLPKGTYDVKYSYPNFEDVTGFLTIDINGNVIDEMDVLHSKINIPKIGGNVVVPKGTLPNQDTKWDYSTGINHYVSTDYESNAYFTNVTGERYVVEAIIKNVHPRIDRQVIDLRAGIIFDAIYDGSVKRNAVILDQTEGKIRPWINNAYDNVNATSADLDISSEIGHKLTIIRDNATYYIFLDGVFIKSLNNGHVGEAAIGFQTLGSGATYSNYLYSFNNDLIDAMIASTKE